MTLDLGDALTDGLGRLRQRNALLLFVLYLVVLLVATVAVHTLMQLYVELLQGLPGSELPAAQLSALDPWTVLALPIGWAGGAALLLVGWVLQETANVVSDRTFVSDETDSLHQPTRRLPQAVVNALVAVVVLHFFYVMAAIVGIIALVVGSVVFPIVVAVLFYFTRQEIAVADKHFIDALTDSVQLTKGNRVEVFALMVVLFVPMTALSAAGGALPGIAGALARVVVLAAFAVFNSAVVAQAYRQLVAANRDGTEQETEERVGALTADDLDRSNQVQQEDSFGTVDFDFSDEQRASEEPPSGGGEADPQGSPSGDEDGPAEPDGEEDDPSFR